MDDVLYHLMIPDEEVETRDKKLMNITPDPGLDFAKVIRADVPVRDLKRFTNDPVIYRVEQTGFFQLTPSSVTSLEGFDMQLDPSVDIR